jgi:hypothetical protein
MNEDAKVRILYNKYGYYRGAMAGSVFDINGIAPTITTMEGGGRQPMIFEIDDEEENNPL